MKNLFFLFGIIILISSCNTYQLVSVNSNLQKNESSEFIHESDTFKLVYSFSGWNCPLNIHIFNKTGSPIYVDWSKSSVIIDNQRISYWSNQPFDEQISFIPPNSGITISKMTLRDKIYDLPSMNAVQVINLPTSNGMVKSKKFSLPNDDESIQFRSFISISTHEDFSNVIYSDDTFWVSDVIQTTTHPNFVMYKPQNQFFLMETSEGATVFTGILGVTLLLALGLLSAE